ncbi:unnamed protein product [Trichobilharzia regenti]|nr:unnamed protein product [Trichobilharzia regenti]
MESSYLLQLIKCLLKTDSNDDNECEKNDNYDYGDTSNDVDRQIISRRNIQLESICIELLQQMELIIPIYVGDTNISRNGNNNNNSNRQYLIPSLLATRCFQSCRPHSYLQPAVIRYKVN